RQPGRPWCFSRRRQSTGLGTVEQADRRRGRLRFEWRSSARHHRSSMSIHALTPSCKRSYYNERDERGSLVSERRVNLPYGRDGNFQIELSADRIVAEKRAPPALPDFEQSLADALARPLDYPPVSQAV